MASSPECRLRKVWRAMLHRCDIPSNPAFHNYGGRGITVCESWRVFDHFRNDMGFAAPGMTLERKDNNGPYCPENCIWATRKQQNRNRRANRQITYQGETHCLIVWAEKLGMGESFLRRRMDVQGMTFEQAVQKPKRYSIWRRSRIEPKFGLRQ